MRESVLKRHRRFERSGKRAQALAEPFRKLIEFLIQSLQGAKLIQNLSELVLETAHRFEQFGQFLDMCPKLAQRFKHTPKLRKLSYGFQNRRYLSELILKRLYLLKHRLYRERGVKRNLLICHSSLSSQQQPLSLTVDRLYLAVRPQQ